MSSDIMITAKFHKTGFEIILAACDSELLGATLEEGNVNISVNEGFFGNEEFTPDEFRGMLTRATSANLVGKTVVGIAIEEGCVLPEAVATVKKIPYAMFFCMG
jgi:hypothetical protein